MQDKFHHHFDTMDSLSQQGVPYFFIIDFLMENVEVFTEKELSERGILVDFKGFKNVQPKEISQDLEWKIYPEDKETYEKGFQIVQENLKKAILTSSIIPEKPKWKPTELWRKSSISLRRNTKFLIPKNSCFSHQKLLF